MQQIRSFYHWGRIRRAGVLALLGLVLAGVYLTGSSTARDAPTLMPDTGPPGTTVTVSGLDESVTWDQGYWDSGDEGGGYPLEIVQVTAGGSTRPSFAVPLDAAPGPYRVLLASSQIQCIRAPCGMLLAFSVTER
jgi:hypothetical protein